MKKLFLVCNAHMDPVWQWRWHEGLGAALSTFRVAADFCEQYDGFVFCHNEALLYEWTERYDPVLFGRIRQLVAAGKWRIMGGWYLQPDCNMPSGESILRQIKTGRDYFREKFGVTPTTAVSLDCFGHSKGLVQILRKTGYDSYLFMRPDPGTGLLDDLPQKFRWEGYAGYAVKGYRINTPYNTLYGHAAETVAAYLKENKDSDCDLIRLWGIGDHGGGPSRVDLENINQLIEDVKPEIEASHSCPEDYMATLDIDTLPRFDRDLNPIDAGTYTSMHKVKQLHRRLEARLMTAERAASLCDMNGLADYPTEALTEAWKDLLFCEFHDILPGTSVKAAEEDSIQRLYHGLDIADGIVTRSLYALAAGQKPPRDGEIPLFVFNTHPYPVKDVFECEFMLADQNWSDNFTSGTVYCNGQPLPTQMEKEASSMNLDWRKRVCFEAELPPMSLCRFDCKLEILPEKPFRIIDMTQTPTYTIRNDAYTCVFDTVSGTLRSFVLNGREYVREGFGGLDVYADTCDPWLINGKAITEYKGSFRPLTPAEATAYAGSESGQVTSMRVVEDGDARTSVEVLMGYGASRARILYTLPKHSAEIGIEYTVHWNEHDTMLRAVMPHTLKAPSYTGQDMFGNKRLTDEYEMVAGRYVIADDGDYAMAVINDSTYGMMLTPDAVRPSLLRAPTYTSHKINDRLRLPLERYYSRMDQGEHTFGFRVLFGTSGEINETADQKAQIFNEFPFAVSAFCAGHGDKMSGNIEVENLRMDTLKRSDDGTGYVMRLYNPRSTPVVGVVRSGLLGINAEIRLNGMEFETVYVSKGVCRKVDTITER
ncbi:MAG: alpha-mannosidase [Clostridia bacterium]|nr:alpha-mannosidase [Clostridia bacterium]